VRVAIVAQNASAGGGTRFLRALVHSLADRYDDLDLTVFYNAEAAAQSGTIENLRQPRVALEPVSALLYALPKPPLPRRPNRRTFDARKRAVQRRLAERKARRELRAALGAFDITYLAWPYFLEPLEIAGPVVATFHDFNFKHGFTTFGPDWVRVLECQVPYWLDRCAVVITSSAFIAGDVERFYPGLARDHQVVRLSTLRTTDPTADEIAVIRQRYELTDPYLICPSNTSPHKNLGNLLRAYGDVRRRGGPKLVFTGYGTECLRTLDDDGSQHSQLLAVRESLRESGLRPGTDVVGFGYVPDADVDALIAGAELLVAPSLYEAGSGPGVDAWSLGTPVAFSAIPPFEEHLEFLGVRAALFDPLDPTDIASSIEALLGDLDRRETMAMVSAEAMSRYTWAQVAAGYRQAFDAAVGRAG
jgi:glycosyltransferase involved in cell wall biosynthesis